MDQTQETPKESINPEIPAKQFDKPKKAKRYKKRPLTLKQKKFVQEYVKHGNATKAVQASYAPTDYVSQRVIGYNNLQKPYIREEILSIFRKANLTPERIAQKLNEIIDGDETSEINKSLWTASEIMGLIGPLSAVQVNVNTAGNPSNLDLIRQKLADRAKKSVNSTPNLPTIDETEPKHNSKNSDIIDVTNDDTSV